MNHSELEIFSDSDAVAQAAAEALIDTLKTLSSNKQVVHIALTGGTVGILTLKKLSNIDSSSVDWSRVHIWWGDERFVHSNSPDRNANQARDAWLRESAVPEQNIHEFPSSDHHTLTEAAAVFDRRLEEFWRAEVPKLDIILLGVGPDGHVASLFPDHPQHIPNRLTVIESDSPKPPAQRLSFSFEMLENADEVWFTVAGADKSEAVAAAFSGNSDLPVARVHAQKNRWFVDEAAAARL